MRYALLTLNALAVVSAGAAAQTTLASRIGQVRDGMVRMEFPSRSAVCGDGRDVIAYRNSYFSRDMQSWGGHWTNRDCKPGPVRVSLSMSGGELVQIRTQVGGNWRGTDERVTDLGVVSSREAAAYFFSMAARYEDISDKGRGLLPAVLAADAQVIEPLKAIAVNESRATHLRRQAIQWLGLVGDASVIPDLVRLAKASDAGEKKSVSGSAIAALAGLEDDAGIPALLELSHYQSSDVRREVVFWLGQTEDPRAIRRLHQVIDDRDEENKVRSHAIFALGQSEAAPTKDLVDIYRAMDERSLKEQAIFALSQRDDNAAMEALLAIAKDDSDKRMRGKAMFWLAQKKDPRVTRLLSDILVK